MHHYRQALLRMRQGDSDRDIAKSRLMGRRSAAALRHLAGDHGWLAPDAPLPDDATIAGFLAAGFPVAAVGAEKLPLVIAAVANPRLRHVCGNRRCLC